MALTPGSRWKSAVCDTEIVIVKPPAGPGALECGGAPMLGARDERVRAASPAPGLDGGALLGKRYGDDETGVEVLCTKSGAGALTFAGRALEQRGAKRLPSSD